MRGSGRSAARAFLTVVVLLLAALLGAGPAFSQPNAGSPRTSPAASSAAAVPAANSGPAEDDCNPRHGPRRASGVTAPADLPVRKIRRGARTGAWPDPETHVVRHRAARERSVRLPLLHRTFRC